MPPPAPLQSWLSAAAWSQCAALYPYPDPSVGGDCGADHAPCLPSALYNALVAPLTVGPREARGGGEAGHWPLCRTPLPPSPPLPPVRIAGTIWFQGENDQGEGSPADDYAFPYYSCGELRLRRLLLLLRLH